MGSTRPTDRSLGEATFLPQWMKGKLENRFDYTDSTFSPPADDPFFFIPYPNRRQEVPVTSTNAASSGNINNNKESKDSKYIDFSKHPAACQPYIPSAEKVHQPKVIIANKPKTKYQATESDFHNVQAAECGRSIVDVANQIMSSTFGKSASTDASSSSHQQSQQHRRGSKSLPATPIASPTATPDSSPKSRRRAYGNRFFTGVFIPSESHKNGWLLGSILSSSREIVTPKIAEEDEQPAEPIPARALSRKKSISSQNLTYVCKDDKPEKPAEKSSGMRAQILMAKPSELREMNFWSPTSM